MVGADGGKTRQATARAKISGPRLRELGKTCSEGWVRRKNNCTCSSLECYAPSNPDG